ncbi:MAG TPA: serine protease [Alphaproteobacteria bacterium]|nr:serine protease [Alphaproteobacteria bacterium]
MFARPFPGLLRPAIAAAALLLALATLPGAGATAADPLPDTIARVKPSIVAVGTYLETRRPPAVFYGTGFVVGDGLTVATNAHVATAPQAAGDDGTLAVFTGAGDDAAMRSAEVLRTDGAHDLALLAVAGPALPALMLGDAGSVREGQRIAFTGFPLGTVLGLHPATHTGIVAARTPYASPVLSPGQLTPDLIRRLRDNITVFQLDATAYPGNSGSPVYDPDIGRVVAVLNSVFVKQSKETLLSDPSGISYAIPVGYLQNLLTNAR